MSEVIAGVQVPETEAVAEATRLIQETTSPLIYHHSRRIFFFSEIHAHKLGKQGETTQVLRLDEGGEAQTVWTYGEDAYPPRG